ncbi:hypothetical protein [Pseudomonas lopnurensis]|uniref:hypothetical protein n=1 Tax=Pseudomonas lopnurensis TaxID=1477517 RepID=UPI00187AC170|nr:hypothetical protein [Pseudomonas lopnurensis]MBE7376594.1 hypothetical protein [Pseudomonas lopnurensis]
MIKPLGRSISSSIQNLRPPDSETVFEDFCLDLFKIILKKEKIAIYNKVSPGYITFKGASGDKQYGIDIKCKTSLAVAQCKLVKDLYPSDLDEEIVKLKKYGAAVSHYFFLISNERVKSSLQDWVDERNKETEEIQRKERRFPVTPDICLPWIYILGWTEIKSHLLESPLLCMKRGALDGFAARYPYLQGLDIERLDWAIKKLNSAINAAPCSVTISGCRSLTDQLDVEALRQLGLNPRVNISILKGLNYFVELFDASHSVAQTYDETIRKLWSEDPITYSEGIRQLNLISYHSARIYALPYLRQAYCAAKYLLRNLNQNDFFYDELETYDDEQGYCETYTNFRIYNFVNPNEDNPPWYLPPAAIQKEALRLVKELEYFRN